MGGNQPRAMTMLGGVSICTDVDDLGLDVSVQAAILNLLTELHRREQVAYLFISHDLGVVRYLSDRIAVLYLGRLMEVGPAEAVFSGPHHPYTEALLSAVPSLDGTSADRIKLEGEIPSAAEPPSGCVFHTRCPRHLGAICDTQEPLLLEAQPGHANRCHIPWRSCAGSRSPTLSGFSRRARLARARHTDKLTPDLSRGGASETRPAAYSYSSFGFARSSPGSRKRCGFPK